MCLEYLNEVMLHDRELPNDPTDAWSGNQVATLLSAASYVPSLAVLPNFGKWKK